MARAAALCGLGRFEDGLTTFDEWLPRLADDRYDASPLVAQWRARMGLCALQAGHRKQAREGSALASAALTKQPDVSAHFKAPILELERRLRGK
jgi:Tfp pilus assembly protein PilF